MIFSKNYQNKIKGFVLTELLVTVTILVLISASVYSIFFLSQRAYKESAISAEITQNGRVITERMTREIRQARQLAIDLPNDKASSIHEIIFEDGHISDQYHYIRYFLADRRVYREISGYYFSGDALQTLVPYNAVPPPGQSLVAKVLEAPKTIGEFVDILDIWKLEGINISLGLAEENKDFYLETKIFGRNF